MSVTLTADLREFRAQMDQNRKLSKKTGAEFLNKRSVQVLIGSKGHPGAVSTTKKVTKAKLKRDLARKWHGVTILHIQAVKALKAQGIKATSDAIAAMSKRIFAARDASRAYLAAGWLHAVRAMGHTRRSDNNRSLRPVGTSRGRIGYGKLATAGKLRFEAYNNAESNGPHDNPARRKAIITEGLNLAVRGQIADMKQYLQKQMEKMLLKNSDAKVK
jgi:hypothetical protein